MYREDLNSIPGDKLQYYKDRMNDEGISLWEKNISMLSELQKLDFPQVVKNQVKLIIEYSELRRKSCNIMQELLGNPSDSLNNELNTISKQIEDKLSELEKLNKNNR